ncbi:MAG: hypothetical protein NC548_22690 [Lachnospiraceae bacterium]|nr:hypothetical protein [Lachnospiraceae bacterium]
MTGQTAYALSKKIAIGAVSGIDDITLNNNELKFQFKDGSSTGMQIPIPEDGVSIEDVKIENNHLIITLSDKNKIDAG